MSNLLEKQEIRNIIKEKFSILSHPPFGEELANAGTIHQFKAGEIVMDYGAYIRFVPLIIDGVIKVLRQNEDGEEILLYYLSGGESCAASFSCCLIQKRSEIKTVAEEDTRLISIPLKYADQWLGTFSVWRNFILNMYDQRIYDLIEAIDRIAFSNMDEQLVNYLDEKSRVTGLRTITTTHQEIAGDLHASREAVSRLLKKLENKGNVKLGRNQITLLK